MSKFLSKMATLLRELLVISPIHFYQRYFSPLWPQKCRFIPCCSRYAIEAVRRFGALRGLLMAGCRLLRCNPLFRGGYDPVPQRFSLRPFAAAHQQNRQQKSIGEKDQ